MNILLFILGSSVVLWASTNIDGEGTISKVFRLLFAIPSILLVWAISF